MTGRRALLLLLVLTLLPLALLLGGRGAPSDAETTTDPVLMAAGDVACDPKRAGFNGGLGTADICRAQYTSDLVVGSDATAVAALGDLQYACGSLTAFQQSYDLSWGRFKAITHPTLGNHEIVNTGTLQQTGCDATNTGAAGYFGYFGAGVGNAGQGWYSYDLGSWHVVVLNSNCSWAGGCGTASAQGQWLKQDLAAHPAACTLAYFHHPLFATGGGNAAVKPLWDMLYAADTDVVLNGHVHRYERFVPLSPAGVPDPQHGIREFIVGTGGEDHQLSTATVDSRAEAFEQNTFGVLRLQLSDGGYGWQFLPEAGRSYTDSGTAACDPSSSDTTPPGAPTGLTGSAPSPTQVSLSWTAPTDDTGVASYRVLRDGVQVGTSATPSYTDSTVAASTAYSYQVTALDAAGNESTPSDAFQVTTPAAPPQVQTLTIPVSADAHVNVNKPNQNLGLLTPMLADGSPRIRSFLRFDVTGVGGRQVLGAQLRLYVANASPSGGSVSRTDGRAWTETGLTWNNQPGIAASPLTSIGAVTAGSTQTVDVTPAVTGDGTVDLAITSTNGDDVGYASRQASTATRRPVLVLTVQ